jgi:hypothetical protein
LVSKLPKFALDKNFGMHIILSAESNKAAGSKKRTAHNSTAVEAQRSNAGVGTEMGRHRFIVAKFRAAGEK